MVLSQNVSVALSLLGLCSIVGAGVAVGSGVGMMAMQVAEAEEQNATQVTAHSPVEKKVQLSKGFAASGMRQ